MVVFQGTADVLLLGLSNRFNENACPFLVVPWVGTCMWSVIVSLPGHIRLFLCVL